MDGRHPPSETRRPRTTARARLDEISLEFEPDESGASIPVVTRGGDETPGPASKQPPLPQTRKSCVTVEGAVYLPCPCGNTHVFPDPGKNMRFTCRNGGGDLIYECRLGQAYRLRGETGDLILDGEIVTLGRSDASDVVLDDLALSKRHARLTRTPSGFVLEDLGSKNGTFVNEVRVGADQCVLLTPGNLIRLGRRRYRYLVPETSQDSTLLVNKSRQRKTRVLLDKLVGQTVGRYKIESVLAQGGMGRVYLARHADLDRRCVVKVILPEMRVDEEMAQRFLREVLLTGRISHPNIIFCYDGGHEGEILYLAMEYFEGRDLYALYGEKTAGLAEALSIVRQAAEGLQAAHEADIVHRDIKPKNIMVGAGGAVKILDFGLAKAKQDPEFVSITASRCVIGTPAFMAPEQVWYPSAVDARADVYGLGAILYFLLTGAPPHTGADGMEVLKKVGEPVAPPSSRRAGLPAALDATVLRALAVDKTERFQSAAELAAALASIRGAKG